MKHNSDFKYDLEIGLSYETALYELLGKKIEVKRDFQCLETGNIFVEYESRNKPSGIATSEADYYCYWLSEKHFVMVEKDELRRLCRKYLKSTRDVYGGDANTSKGILFPLNDFFLKIDCDIKIILIFAYNFNLTPMKNLFKSLALFQQEVPVIHKATQGYGYSYADLPKIFEVINPLLQKHGLGFTQTLNTKEGTTYLCTTVFHAESGECIDSMVEIPQVALKGMNDYQSFGSGVTYYRRYALSSALGLVTDKDTDASGEQVKDEQPKQKKSKIDSTRFNKAIEAIKNGEYQIEQLIEKFDLDASQLKQITEL